MKRREIEQRVGEFTGKFSTKVEGNPIPAFFVGVLVGVFLTVTRSFILPILIVGSVLCWVLWLLGDLDDQGEFTEDQQPQEPLPEKEPAVSLAKEPEAKEPEAKEPEAKEPEAEEPEAVADAEQPIPEETLPVPKEAEVSETYTPIKPVKADKPAAKSKKKRKSTSTNDDSSVNGAAINGTGKSSDSKTAKNAGKSKPAKAKPKSKSSTKKKSAKSKSKDARQD